MNGKGFGVVGREGARRGGIARLAAVAVVGVVGLGLAGGLSACSSDPSTKPAAMSTPLTPTVTVTSTRPAAPASTAPAATKPATPASTAASTAASTSTATDVATRSGATTTSTGSPRPATLDPALVGRWTIHDSMLTIRADGTGTVLSHGCTMGPNGQSVCDLLDTVRVTPMGSGARLTVVATQAYLSSGTPGQEPKLVPVPSWVDPSEGYDAVGDYSVLEPFTAATWPYDTPITTADQRAVYSWRLAHRGGSLGDPKNVLARQCHDGLPVSAALRTYCG